MPIVLPTAQTSLLAALTAVGDIGTPDVPQLATGLAMGLLQWLPQITVTTVDAGTLGAGESSTPIVIPPTTFLVALQANFPSAGLLGQAAPQLTAGLSVGFSTVFGQGILTCLHPSVGTGTGVATLAGPPGLPSFLAGFASSGLAGPDIPQLAQAVSQALDGVINVFTTPVAIVGSASTSPSSGIGTGKIE